MQDPIEQLPSVGNTKIAHLQHYFPEMFDRDGQMKPPPKGQSAAQWLRTAHQRASGWNHTPQPSSKGGAA